MEKTPNMNQSNSLEKANSTTPTLKDTIHREPVVQDINLRVLQVLNLLNSEATAVTDSFDPTIEMVNTGRIQEVVNTLGDYYSLPNTVAKALIEHGYASKVIYNLVCFQPLSQELALQLVKEGFLEAICQNPHKFPLLNDEILSIALQLNEPQLFTKLQLVFGKFSNLSAQTADEMISLQPEIAISIISEHINKFSELSSEVAITLIQHKKIKLLAMNLGKFTDFSFSGELADHLVQTGHASQVALNLELFTELLPETVLNLIMKGYHPQIAHHFVPRHRNLTVKIAEELLARGLANAIAKNLSSFQQLNMECAQLLLQAGFLKELLLNLETFTSEAKEKILLQERIAKQQEISRQNHIFKNPNIKI